MILSSARSRRRAAGSLTLAVVATVAAATLTGPVATPGWVLPASQ